MSEADWIEEWLEEEHDDLYFEACWCCEGTGFDEDGVCQYCEGTGEQ